MFHLLVKFNGWEYSRDSLNNQRIFEYTDEVLTTQFKPNGNLDINQISQIPAIFASETGGSGEQIIKFGHIYRIIPNPDKPEPKR
ncbi:MAG: hypothetical protein U9R57_06335 [Thermodesulfobacteriota bacterium]|nr:hypothetical protein [Thermodesulfobacteriota bacterium]